MAGVPYCLRHAAVSLWIKQGVDPVEVAYRAGHSVAVLYRFYAKLLKGSSTHANSLIQKALGRGRGRLILADVWPTRTGQRRYTPDPE